MTWFAVLFIFTAIYSFAVLLSLSLLSTQLTLRAPVYISFVQFLLFVDFIFLLFFYFVFLCACFFFFCCDVVRSLYTSTWLFEYSIVAAWVYEMVWKHIYMVFIVFFFPSFHLFSSPRLWYSHRACVTANPYDITVIIIE